jgi:hypothetical protein
LPARGRVARERAGLERGGEIEDLVADRHAAERLVLSFAAEDAERQFWIGKRCRRPSRPSCRATGRGFR